MWSVDFRKQSNDDSWSKAIHMEILKKKMKETIVKINKIKCWFFEKINKIDKPLTRLIKNKREKNQH